VTAFERARSVVEAYVPEESGVKREALIDAIRREIVQAEIAVKQPPELPESMACTVVYQILYFVDEQLARMRGASYAEQANALRECRIRILAMYGIETVERKPVQSAEVGIRRKAARA